MTQQEQTKRKLRNRSGTIRATSSEVKIDQFEKSALNAAKEGAKQFLDKDIMEIHMIQYIKNPHIRSEYAKTSNELINCKQNTSKEFAILNYGLTNFCDYKYVTESTEFSNEQVDFIYQEGCAVWSLLSENFKRKDSGLNKLKAHLFTLEEHHLSNFPNSEEWWYSKQARYLLAERNKQKLLEKLKEWLAGDISALFGNFMRLPHCSLPIQVYSNVPDYFRYRRNKIENFFFKQIRI